MFWVIFGIIVVVLFVWLNNKGKPKNFARGVAKAQLTGYKRFSRKGLSKKDVYIKTISSRPGVYKYYSLSEIENDAEKSSFGTMVEILINREFLHRTGKMPTMEELNIMSSEVHRVIPNNY